MATGNKRSLFWISYSDLMTSLFFTMLVLFVVVVIAMAKARQDLVREKQQLELKNKEYENILQLRAQFEALTQSTHLAYDDDKRIFYVKDFTGKEIFAPESDVILPEYLATVDDVGQEIKTIVDNLSEHGNFAFQLVIEGTAAIFWKDKLAGTYDPDNEQWYLLSYRRALALYRRWKDLGLRQDNTEVLIAGSGYNGINRDTKVEDNNKRFIVQIIPKIARPTEDH